MTNVYDSSARERNLRGALAFVTSLLIVAALAAGLVSAEADPTVEWIAAVATVLGAIVIGVVIFKLTRELDERSTLVAENAEALDAAKRRIDGQAANLSLVVGAAREFGNLTNPTLARTRICEVASTLAQGDHALLFEPRGDGAALRITASTRPDLLGIEQVLVDGPSGAVASFTSAKPLFAPLAAGHPMLSQVLVKRTGAASVLFQPVVRDGKPVAVLCVFWHQLKPFLSDRRMALVELLANEAANAIERVALLARLAELARTDEMTGLPNRRDWEEALPRELARAQRERSPLSVAMIDLDRFKRFNDLHGHQSGDRLLKQAASAWQEQLRATDVLARYGGEEFALALPSCEIKEALALGERLRGATPSSETCSIGIAQWNGTESGESLVNRADAALYKAKAGGRDKVVVANWLPALRSA